MQPMATNDCSADTEFVGAQHGRHDDVATGLDAAVDAQLHLVAQTVEGQHLVGFGQDPFPTEYRRI